jgi:hypothetical protein
VIVHSGVTASQFLNEGDVYAEGMTTYTLAWDKWSLVTLASERQLSGSFDVREEGYQEAGGTFVFTDYELNQSESAQESSTKDIAYSSNETLSASGFPYPNWSWRWSNGTGHGEGTSASSITLHEEGAGPTDDFGYSAYSSAEAETSLYTYAESGAHASDVQPPDNGSYTFDYTKATNVSTVAEGSGQSATATTTLDNTAAGTSTIWWNGSSNTGNYSSHQTATSNTSFSLDAPEPTVLKDLRIAFIEEATGANLYHLGLWDMNAGESGLVGKSGGGIKDYESQNDDDGSIDDSWWDSGQGTNGQANASGGGVDGKSGKNGGNSAVQVPEAGGATGGQASAEPADPRDPFWVDRLLGVLKHLSRKEKLTAAERLLGNSIIELLREIDQVGWMEQRQAALLERTKALLKWPTTLTGTDKDFDIDLDRLSAADRAKLRQRAQAEVARIVHGRTRPNDFTPEERRALDRLARVGGGMGSISPWLPQPGLRSAQEDWTLIAGGLAIFRPGAAIWQQARGLVTAETGRSAVGQGSLAASASRGVTATDSIQRGLVKPDGKLANVISGIEREVLARPPRTLDQAFEIVEKVTGRLGLEVGAGRAGWRPGMDLVLENVGGIVTTIRNTGEILIRNAKGEIIFHFLP